METIKELFRIGKGPSSSHTMGPATAVKIFKEKNQDALWYRVTLYGSLAATGKGHLTEQAIREILPPHNTTIIFRKDKFLYQHPNGMLFEAEMKNGKKIRWLVFSIGGGAIRDLKSLNKYRKLYPHKRFQEISNFCSNRGMTLYGYVYHYEGKEFKKFLFSIWKRMQEVIKKGLKTEGILLGPLKLERKAGSIYIKSCNSRGLMKKVSRVFSYALAVAEENADGGIIVTAPTCGSSGVLPAVLKYCSENYKFSEEKIINALAIAGLFGNLIKHNASISGAEVGCQGEIGTACSMAASAATYLLGGSIKQIEYAAEMALEHHLGLTCDPVAGMVQVPCIERNAMAAERALDCAVYALQTDGTHKVSFDEVVKIMKQTGQDLKIQYRETSAAGLATILNTKTKNKIPEVKNNKGI